MSRLDSELDAMAMGFLHVQLVPVCHCHTKRAGSVQPVLAVTSVELLSDLGQPMPTSPHMSSVVVGKQPQAWPPVLDHVLAPSKVFIILEDRCPALLLGGKLHHLAGSKSKTTEFQQQVQGCSTDQLHQLAFLCALCTPKLHFKILLG